MQEQTIFDLMYPKYKIDKPIRLIELFGGYGSQYLSLKYLGANVEHWKLVEWASKSIQAYNDIHIQDYNDYCKNLTDDEVLDKITKLGVSLNYNEPATREQLKRQDYRKIYNNIVATKDLVNIQQVKGKDLDIKDTDKYIYVCTYSFPCQDLSNAGLKKGMSDTSTRSGLLWEVERILTELDEKPQILLMENVPQVHDENNKNDFKKWILRLEELGYKNYFQDLIATDYGIPQTRNRCFMISLLGDYSYSFPPRQELKLKLKDMLEKKVNEKYYLSDKQLENLENGNYNASKPSVKLEITDKGLCQTLDTMSGGNRQPLVRVKRNEIADKLIKENKVKENDTLYTNFITRREKENDFVQNNNISPTLTTSADEVAVCGNLSICKK